MAARINSRQAETTRSHIQANRICAELQKFVDGEREMSAAQVQAARILLDKSMPSLMAQAIEAEGAELLIPILKIVPHESDKAA